MDWFGFLAVQQTLKSLLQHHSSKASIFRCSAFFGVQLSHPYLTTVKTITLTRQSLVGKVMSLFFNMLSRCHSFSYKECLLISWLQSPSTMILLQEGGTLPVPKSLTLGNELSKETHRLTKQESLLGRGTWAECSRIRIPGELLCLVACSLWFYDEGIIFQVVFGQSF